MSSIPLKPWQAPVDLPLIADLPTMYDLPSENPEEPGLPDEFHYYQPQLLRETFCPPDYPPEQICVATDLNLYYDLQHTTWYKRPDWFAVLGVPRFYEGHELRYSYVIWQEQVVPFIVIELLSEGTESEDLGQTVRDIKQPPTKWQVYEQILQIPYYIVFGRQTNQLRGFHWQTGRYQALTLSEGKVWLPEIQLGIGMWQGAYQGLERQWLRWYDAQHRWIPTPLEQLTQERQRAERLVAQLRALGVEPQ